MESYFNYITRVDGKITLSLGGGWSGAIKEELAKKKYDCVSFGSGDWNDFSFLKDFADDIDWIRVSTNAPSFKGLEALLNLRDIDLDGAGKEGVALEAFSKLERAKLYWQRKYSKRFFALPRLVEISITKYTEADCSDVAEAKSLRQLEFIQGSLRSLDGLGALQSLEKIELTSLTQLTDIRALAGLSHLNYLHLDGARKITDLAAVFEARALRYLWIDKVGARVDDLSWLGRLAQLEVAVVGAVVSKPDWEAVFRHPALRRISFAHLADYKIDEKAITSLAGQFGKQIVKLSAARLAGGPAIVCETRHVVQ